MKTIISTILIIAGAVILHSCREPEIEDLVESKKLNLNTSKTETFKNADSTWVEVLSNDPETDESLEDPPIRHGGQWKNND